MKASERRVAILESAAPIFNQRGFAGTSIADVLAATDLEKGGLYNHFASKEELAVEVVKRYALSYDIDAVLTGAEPALVRLRDQFHHIGEQTIGSHLADGCLLGNFSTELAPHSEMVRELLASIFVHWAEVVAAVLREAQDQGDLDNAYEGAMAAAKVSRDRAPLDMFMQITFATPLVAAAA